jgi:hypothetical protein
MGSLLTGVKIKKKDCTITISTNNKCRSQWPRGLRRWSAAERLLESLVRIPQGAWMSVSCTVFLLSGRGLCGGPIPRPEESYRLWCVSEYDQVKIKKKRRHLLLVGRKGEDYETNKQQGSTYYT